MIILKNYDPVKKKKMLKKKNYDPRLNIDAQSLFRKNAIIFGIFGPHCS